MISLFSAKKDEEGKLRLQINPIGKLFSDTNYLIDMTVCPDPTCDCGSNSIYILKEENIGTMDMEYRLPNNVYEERMNSQFHENFYSKETNGRHIHGLFANGLTSEDWSNLKENYRARKFVQVEQVNPDNIDIEFEEEQHEDVSLMFPYYDAFPSSIFHVKLNGKDYEVLDVYCKNPACLCTDMILNIYENNDGASTAKSIGDCDYNYKTKELVNIQGNQAIVTSVVQQILNTHGNTEQLFGRRNKIVRKLYAKSVSAYHKARQARNPMKISRNQLCPCGSGKKYKRCCLRKDEARG